MLHFQSMITIKSLGLIQEAKRINKNSLLIIIVEYS